MCNQGGEGIAKPLDKQHLSSRIGAEAFAEAIPIHCFNYAIFIMTSDGFYAVRLFSAPATGCVA